MRTRQRPNVDTDSNGGGSVNARVRGVREKNTRRERATAAAAATRGTRENPGFLSDSARVTDDRPSSATVHRSLVPARRCWLAGWLTGSVVGWPFWLAGWLAHVSSRARFAEPTSCAVALAAAVAAVAAATGFRSLPDFCVSSLLRGARTPARLPTEPLQLTPPRPLVFY